MINTDSPRAGPALALELRRGTLVLAVLSALRRLPACGADLRDALNRFGIPIEEGALYPMLRRLESQGILASERRMEGSRHKRIYALTADGDGVHSHMLAQWHQLDAGLTAILEET